MFYSTGPGYLYIRNLSAKNLSTNVTPLKSFRLRKN
jgi:hypothetical protein